LRAWAFAWWAIRSVRQTRVCVCACAPARAGEPRAVVVGQARPVGAAPPPSPRPTDTIKVLLQTQSSTNPVYSGMVDATKKTIKAEGLAGLYKGVQSPLAGAIHGAWQWLAAAGWRTRARPLCAFCDAKATRRVAARHVAAAVAVAVAAAVACVVWCVCGLGACVTACSPPLVPPSPPPGWAGQMFFNAVQFTAYSSMKDMMTEGGKTQTAWAFAKAGAVTGFFVTLIEAPQVLLGRLRAPRAPCPRLQQRPARVL
jgi:hypothetical protein